MKTITIKIKVNLFFADNIEIYDSATPLVNDVRRVVDASVAGCYEAEMKWMMTFSGSLR